MNVSGLNKNSEGKERNLDI